MSDIEKGAYIAKLEKRLSVHLSIVVGGLGIIGMLFASFLFGYKLKHVTDTYPEIEVRSVVHDTNDVRTNRRVDALSDKVDGYRRDDSISTEFMMWKLDKQKKTNWVQYHNYESIVAYLRKQKEKEKHGNE